MFLCILKSSVFHILVTLLENGYFLREFWTNKWHNQNDIGWLGSSLWPQMLEVTRLMDCWLFNSNISVHVASSAPTWTIGQASWLSCLYIFLLYHILHPVTGVMVPRAIWHTRHFETSCLKGISTSSETDQLLRKQYLLELNQPHLLHFISTFSSP